MVAADRILARSRCGPGADQRQVLGISGNGNVKFDKVPIRFEWSWNITRKIIDTIVLCGLDEIPIHVSRNDPVVDVCLTMRPGDNHRHMDRRAAVPK